MRFLPCLLLLALSLDAAAGDLYAAVNRQRAGAGYCKAVENMPPLKPQAALERIARDLSQGVALKQSEKQNGYRTMRTRSLSFKGEGIGAQVEAILARQSYCPQLQEAEFTDVGIYEDAREVLIVLAAPYAPKVALSAPEAAQRVLDLVNQTRASPRVCGDQAFAAARPVRWNETLAAASRLHAEDMARNNYISHSGRDGSTPAQRVARAGYRYRVTGENLAGGGRMQADDAVAGWIRSPGHCANLMNPAYTEMGVAFAVNAASEMGIYWAQVLGAPR